MLGAVTAVLLVAGGAAVDDETWGVKEIDDYVRLNHPITQTQSDDPFAAPPAMPAPAQSIVMRWPIVRYDPQGVSDSTVATWKYDAVAQTMTIEGQTPGGYINMWDFQGRRDEVPDGFGYSSKVYHTHTRTVRADAGMGTNAFGVRARLMRETTTERGFVELRRYMNGGIPGNGPYGYGYVHTWSILPEEARTLSQNLYLEVVAETVPWVPGRWVICGNYQRMPSIDNPTIRRIDACYLTGKLLFVRMLDGRTDEIIMQWARVDP